MANLDILYFAWVRDGIEQDAERIVHPGADVTIAEVIAMLAARGGGYAQALGDPAKLRAALDQNFVPLDNPLGAGTELALFPPVTGG
jgi:molybdopterin synthase sulfur carrier subunit